MAIAVKLAPVARSASRVVRAARRAEDKGVAIDLFAKRSGHTLDVNLQCVKCRLRLIPPRNLAYTEAVLELPCI